MPAIVVVVLRFHFSRVFFFFFVLFSIFSVFCVLFVEFNNVSFVFTTSQYGYIVSIWGGIYYH